MGYENAMILNYRFPAAAIDTAAVIGRIVGPEGKVGRLESIGAVTTVATTDAATELRVGTAADPDKYGILTVPVTAINLPVNADTIYDTDDNQIAADSVVEVSSDGGATAGDADVLVCIAWF